MSICEMLVRCQMEEKPLRGVKVLELEGIGPGLNMNYVNC